MDPKEETNILLWIPSEPDPQAHERVWTSIYNGTEPRRQCTEETEASDENWNVTCQGDNWNVTCQVQIRIRKSSSSSEHSQWTLQSLDRWGCPKQTGGDEFYITYQQYNNDETDEPPVQGVAVVTDCQNGSYLLEFVAPPLPLRPLDEQSTSIIPPAPEPQGNGDDDDHSLHHLGDGVLTVHFCYSCGIGTLAPPTKHSWQDGGYTHTCYTLHHVPAPPIREFKTCCPSILSSPTPPSLCYPRRRLPNLSKYDRVIAFGDSNMHQFVRRGGKRGKHFLRTVRFDGDKVTMPLNSLTVDPMIRQLQEQHSPVLSTVTSGSKMALLLGSSSWDLLDYNDTLQGVDFCDHAQACRALVSRLRDLYPHVDLYWKSATAMHIQVVELDQLDTNAPTGAATLRGTDRVRYMSESRSRRLYLLQKQVMEEMNVPLLDIYLATYLSAHVMYPGDGRHYRFELNELMLNWFFRQKENETDKADPQLGGGNL